MTTKNEIVQVGERDLAKVLESVLIKGDLRSLTPAEKTTYYQKVCDGLGLNPLTGPFQYIVLNNKEVLYAKRDCTDQLRKLHHVSIKIASREKIGDVFVVTAQATLKDGRTDESIGAVTTGILKGDALANALMKAETKAKRRVTLSICGLGLLDETEIETIPNAVKPIETKQSIKPVDQGEPGFPSREKQEELFKVARANNYSDEDVRGHLSILFGKTATKDLTYVEYNTILKFFERNPNKNHNSDSDFKTPETFEEGA